MATIVAKICAKRAMNGYCKPFWVCTLSEGSWGWSGIMGVVLLVLVMHAGFVQVMRRSRDPSE